MESRDLFRSCILGGYNKEDVMEYVGALEEEIERLKAQCEPDTVIIVREDTGHEQPLLENAGLMLSAATKEPNSLMQENEQLRAEIVKLQEKVSQHDSDYDAIKKVLLDARIDANVMIQKARDKADDILREAEATAEEQKQKTGREVQREVGDRTLELFMARYRVNDYVEELERAQKNLEGLYRSMKQIADALPSSIEEATAASSLTDGQESDKTGENSADAVADEDAGNEQG